MVCIILVSNFVHEHSQFGLRHNPESSKSFQETPAKPDARQATLLHEPLSFYGRDYF
jgi:hypothetical protein